MTEQHVSPEDAVTTDDVETPEVDDATTADETVDAAEADATDSDEEQVAEAEGEEEPPRRGGRGG